MVYTSEIMDEVRHVLLEGDPLPWIRDQLSHILAGEERLGLLLRVLAESRRLPEPQHVFLVGESAIGKSTLANGVLGSLPEGSWESVTRLTAAAPDYIGDRWRHKVILMQQLRQEDSGSASLQVLLTEQGLRLLMPVRGEEGFELKEYVVQGPLAFWTTSVEPQVDPQMATRVWWLSPDASVEQTERIQRFQARLRCDPLMRVIREDARLKLRCMSELLAMGVRQPQVWNIYAEHVLLNPRLLSARRHQAKLWAAIESIAYIRQYRRIIATHDLIDGHLIIPEPQDVYDAIKLAGPLLPQSLEELDELTQRLLDHLENLTRRLEENSRTKMIDPEKREPLIFTASQVARDLGVHRRTIQTRIQQLINLNAVDVAEEHRGPHPRTYVYLGRRGQVMYHPDTQRWIEELEKQEKTGDSSIPLPSSLEALKTSFSERVKTGAVKLYRLKAPGPQPQLEQLDPWREI